MEKLENELAQVRLQLKRITTFSKHNSDLLADIAHQYDNIITKLYKAKPSIYLQSKQDCCAAIGKLELLRNHDALTKRNAFNIIKRTLLRSIARDLIIIN
ncbi:MAG: hypothetical protein AAGC65_04310 [Mucilaginibacter sp.]|uniref:hypothetical protein n=1 Tax=Mucilaginibacter sp. TaxID=1882438 RepID=UPI0031B4F14C